MAWSKLEVFKARVGLGEGQQAAGGVNHDNNCGPACISVLMQMHGYAYIRPQTVRLAGGLSPGLEPAGFMGTTLPQELYDLVKAHYPDPPPMEIAGLTDRMPGWLRDPIAQLEEWGNAGTLAITLVTSNGAAQLVASGTIGHYVIPLAQDRGARTVTYYNPEWETVEVCSEEFFRQSFRGLYLHDQRPMEDDMLNPQVIKTIVCQAWWQVFGRFPGALFVDAKGQPIPDEKLTPDQLAAVKEDRKGFENIVSWSGPNGEHLLEQYISLTHNAGAHVDAVNRAVAQGLVPGTRVETTITAILPPAS